MVSDAELLKRYAQEQDQGAFADLVRRHRNWVYSSARRQLGDVHLAEDVTQAVFLLLARKAGQLRGHAYLQSWIFRTVYWCVKEARRQQASQQRREREAAAMRPEQVDGAAWEVIAPELDKAVQGLGAKDRDAVLLRFYQGMTLADTGAVLGVSEEAAKKRVQRALEKLRIMLAKKGLTTEATALGVVLAERVTEAASAGAIGSAAAAVTGTSSAGSVGIAEGANSAIHRHRIRRAAPVVALVFVGVVVWEAGEPTPPTRSQPAPQVAQLPTTTRATQVDPSVLASLRAPDLVDLVLATRGRYTSFEVVTRSLAYNKSAITPTDKPFLLKNILWRMSGSRQYFRREMRQVPEGGNVESAPARTFEDSVDPEQVKHLESAYIVPMPRARIERPVRQFHPDASLVDAVWGNFGWGWDKLRDEAATISHDPATGRFRLERRPEGGLRIGATIDPAKGFVPVRFEIYGKDGTLVICVDNSDFRQVGQGLWLPYRTIETNYHPTNPTCVVSEVQDLKINIPFCDSQLDIVFPPGADVHDEITGTRYGGATEFGLPVTMIRPSPNTKSPNANGSFYSKDNVLYAPDLQEPEIPYVVLSCGREDARPFQVVPIVRKGNVPLGKLTASSPSDAIQIGHAELGDERLMRLKISARPSPNGQPLKTEVLVQGVENEDSLRIPVIVVTAPPIDVMPAIVALDAGQSACRVRVGGWAIEKHAPVLERWESADGTLPVSDCKLVGNGREVEISFPAVPRDGGFARRHLTLHLKAGDSRVTVPVTILVPPGEPAR